MGSSFDCRKTSNKHGKKAVRIQGKAGNNPSCVIAQNDYSDPEEFSMIGRPIAIASQHVDGLNTFLVNNREFEKMHEETFSDSDDSNQGEGEASP